jgi:2-amino-4-hydroxy-6-hydroxymethyldihydropteridine diphosphokinase
LNELNDSITVANSKVLFSIGSNVGDKINNIITAVNLLSTVCEIEKKNISSFYETEPYGYQNQDWFMNIALVGTTDLPPESLLFICKSIEFLLGRKKQKRWSERVIDIDILLYDDLIVDAVRLKIPHPHMHKRRFVLVPAAEIGSDIIHPKNGKNISELLDECVDFFTVTKAILQ